MFPMSNSTSSGKTSRESPGGVRVGDVKKSATSEGAADFLMERVRWFRESPRVCFCGLGGAVFAGLWLRFGEYAHASHCIVCRPHRACASNRQPGHNGV